MADEQTLDEQKEVKNEEVVAEEKEQTVKFSTYDKAMNTAAKRKEENDLLKQQIAELQKANMESSKNIDPTKYQEVLETQLAEFQQKYADLENTFKTTLEERDRQDLDRKKLSVVWDIGRKQGMVDDRELLNFIDKEVVQIDENGVVNVKSAETVINKLKASKPYFFQEPKPEKINDRAPNGSDETDISKLSFSQQLALKQNQS